MNDARNLTDAVFLGGIPLATLLSWLPHVAAAVSIVYGLLRIYDWFEQRRMK
jgi:hypothetical protein